MRAWIQYKGVDKKMPVRELDQTENHNYTRWGVKIPHQEIEIDVCKFFNCDQKKALYYASELLKDSRVKFKVENEAKKAIEQLRNIPKENLNMNKSYYDSKKEKKEEIDIDKLKSELKEELKAEMKKESVKVKANTVKR